MVTSEEGDALLSPQRKCRVGGVSLIGRKKRGGQSTFFPLLEGRGGGGENDMEGGERQD